MNKCVRKKTPSFLANTVMESWEENMKTATHFSANVSTILYYFSWTNMHGMFHAICCKPSKAAAEKATEKASAAAENALSSAQELQKEMASIWQACWPVGPRRYIFFGKGSQENWIIGKPLGRQQLILTGSWPFFARNVLQKVKT